MAFGKRDPADVAADIEWLGKRWRWAKRGARIAGRLALWAAIWGSGYGCGMIETAKALHSP